MMRITWLPGWWRARIYGVLLTPVDQRQQPIAGPDQQLVDTQQHDDDDHAPDEARRHGYVARDQLLLMVLEIGDILLQRELPSFSGIVGSALPHRVSHGDTEQHSHDRAGKECSGHRASR